ncbi:F-box/LRR-repeat protein 14-like [Trifolium pratense]|uniref:F-box/LRR-repeat protein 14-like n=1 Tax=Trifolium pratense TaxID=57577 RepID=UPI001E697796|nr:F-box/LRR-repeat protein 14-like [Trifolium pratense]
MKTKRIKTTNSVKPDECWELVFMFMFMDDEDYYALSLVSKQFLSITNRLRSSLTIKPYYDQTTEQVLHLIGRFPNLTSLNFIGGDDIDYILPQLSTFPFRLTSLKLSHMSTIPATGLVTFSSATSSTLNSLTCSYIDFLHSTHMFLIGDCFPKLKRIDLSHCNDICISLLLKKCRNITHLNLTASSIIPLSRIMNFQLPTLEVLNLSYSTADNQTLNVLTKTCTRILQLSLGYCDRVTDKGVKSVLQNCIQLREINLKYCQRVVHLNVDSMLLLRPSLTKIMLPYLLAWVA